MKKKIHKTKTGHKFQVIDLPEEALPKELKDIGLTKPRIFIPLGNKK